MCTHTHRSDSLWTHIFRPHHVNARGWVKAAVLGGPKNNPKSNPKPYKPNHLSPVSLHHPTPGGPQPPPAAPEDRDTLKGDTGGSRLRAAPALLDPAWPPRPPHTPTAPLPPAPSLTHPPTGPALPLPFPRRRSPLSTWRPPRRQPQTPPQRPARPLSGWGAAQAPPVAIPARLGAARFPPGLSTPLLEGPGPLERPRDHRGAGRSPPVRPAKMAV